MQRVSCFLEVADVHVFRPRLAQPDFHRVLHAELFAEDALRGHSSFVFVASDVEVVGFFVEQFADAVDRGLRVDEVLVQREGGLAVGLAFEALVLLA